MQDSTLQPSNQRLATEIEQAVGERKTPCIELSIPSMLGKTAQEIQLEVDKFNEMAEYLIRNGQKCNFLTAEQNDSKPLTYNDLLQLEQIVQESKNEIAKRGAESIVEKARVIEHIVLRKLPEIIYLEDEDFQPSMNWTLIQALEKKKAPCCHGFALTQYLHLRNGIYSTAINSQVHIEEHPDQELFHVFNLLFLPDREGAWTFIDTGWNGRYVKKRDLNCFSFVSLEDIQNPSIAGYEAHNNIEQDLSSVTIVKIPDEEMSEIDKKLGYHNKDYIFPTIDYLCWCIARGNLEEAKEYYPEEYPILQSLFKYHSMIQFVYTVTIISAWELAENGLCDDSQKVDESDTFKYLDTYLQKILPELYLQYFCGRIKAHNPNVWKNYCNTNDYLKILKYATNLFQIRKIMKEKDGKENWYIGISFNDGIDPAYIIMGIDSYSIGVFTKYKFEKLFGPIDEKTDTNIKKDDLLGISQ